MRKIELLIPARNLDAGLAGVDHGADAVYIGGPGFGARGAAGNSVEEIAKLVDYAHPYGVKVYAALNTLIYEDELREAEKLAREIVSAGVDALIVQDTAFLMMGIEDVAFHASTQMCNTSPEHVRFLADAGFSRVVLERGLTLEQVREITGSTGVETECFVHGAICVGHSGQCYLSRSMGPRSGNRGICGQPCRMKYDLEDQHGKVLIRDKHLLSVKDLNLSEYLGDMIDAGVTSFKVEGRLKEIEYVKNITAFYRERLDKEISSRRGLKRSSDGTSKYAFTPDPAKSFSRGFTVWTAAGAKAGSASFDTPKALGEPLGTVLEAGRSYFTLDRKDITLSSGDGVCFFENGELFGTNINRVEGAKVFPNRMDGIKKGTEVSRNYDHRFNSLLNSRKVKRSIPVCIEYTISDECLKATVTDPSRCTATAELSCEWGRAENAARMKGVIESQLAKSGATIFDVQEITGNDTNEIPFIPASALNGLRRELLDRLQAERLRIFEEKKKERLAGVRRDDSCPYPAIHLGGEGNITNSLSRKFWTILHGVERVDEPYDQRSSLDGQRVMVTPYCIRREMGTCLKVIPSEKGKELYLRSGDFRYRLDFDCANCRMSIIKCPDKK